MLLGLTLLYGDSLMGFVSRYFCHILKYLKPKDRCDMVLLEQSEAALGQGEYFKPDKTPGKR